MNENEKAQDVENTSTSTGTGAETPVAAAKGEAPKAADVRDGSAAGSDERIK